MKRKFILASAAVITTALVFTSCQPSRVWATKDKEPKRNYRQDEDYRYSRPTPPPAPARYYSSVSLIIVPTPGFVMKQNPDGRFYHRSMAGYLYWKGYDNRFYLDRAELRNVNYSRGQYEEWKRYSRQSRG